jgi:hypothetical protein
MAGLLDDQGQGGLLSFLKSPEGQGLLAGGFAALGGRSVLGGISRGGLAGLGAYGQAQDAQQTNARLKTMDDRSGQMFNLQLQQHQAALDQAKKAQETQQGQRNYLGAIGNVTSPRLDAQPNQFSPTQWMALGGTAEDAQRLSGMKDWGKSKVARTVEGVDAQGNKVTYQMDEFGRPVGDATQAYIAPVQVDLGGRVQFVQPKAGVDLTKSMSPDARASNAVAWFNANTSRQSANNAATPKPEFRDGQWVVAPRDMKPGETRAATATTGSKDATEALALIKQAREILPNATGSYGGAALDQGARVFGVSTTGAQASAQLKAIGGMLTAKMPKMSGPQSDKDVQLYREMAGRVGDETVPIAERQAALDTVEQIQARYAAGGGASGAWSPTQSKPTQSGPTVSNW